MKIITFKDIASLGVSPIQCYEWAEYMIRNKNKTILPPKISLKPFEGAFCNVMPCVLQELTSTNCGGVKLVTRYPGRVPSLESYIMLFDSDTGDMLALMDGTWITAMRTGAVAAHSIIEFGKTGFKTLGIMGLGNVSRATMLVLAEKLKDRELHVKLLRYKGQEKDFASRFKIYNNIEFTFVDTYSELISESDVIVSGATYLSDDVCQDSCFEEGVLVVPIHTRGFSNCDLFFDKVYADDTGHVKHFKYFDSFKNFAEVSDVINGVTPGRESDKERIIAYNIGLSIHDVFYANAIYTKMKDDGILASLPDINMDNPTEKFWV